MLPGNKVAVKQRLIYLTSLITWRSANTSMFHEVLCSGAHQSVRCCLNLSGDEKQAAEVGHQITQANVQSFCFAKIPQN